MQTFSDYVLHFYSSLQLGEKLPPGIEVMNPFLDNPVAQEATTRFYQQYFSDTHLRYILIGINPGRFGSGHTGIPFTDPIRLQNTCGIPFRGKEFREPSSVFIYEVIERLGGPSAFYKHFYFSSVSPLGFIKKTDQGRYINYNYYDDKKLFERVYPWIIDNLEKQLAFGIRRNIAVCIGTGKNYQILQKINKKHGFFERLIPLEHPRFILQYKALTKETYVQKYVSTLQELRDLSPNYPEIS